MSAYFQMGHDTENLINERDLNEFRGIILSPLNRVPDELNTNISKFRDSGQFDIIFDSQLYFPRSLRKKLHAHPYFPSDLDTADIYSNSWWSKINSSLSEYSQHLKVDAVASPVVHPRSWSTDYYAICAETSNRLTEQLYNTGIRTLSTVMINLHQMVDEEEIYRIASILSDTNSSGFYFVISSDIVPRREFSDANELFGVMVLIKELQNTGLDIFVSHCSSDMVLFKSAGANHCATCKFFNLRRFTKSRWDEPSEGGGLLPYWFEHGLFAFLRKADLLRLVKSGYSNFIKRNFSNNFWAEEILNQFQKEPGKAWVALSWCHYLSWFGKTELSLSKDNPLPLVKEWLKIAEKNWLTLKDDDILFEEPRNNGNWIRPWRQALNDFSKKYS